MARTFLADKGVSCDAEKAVLVEKGAALLEEFDLRLPSDIDVSESWQRAAEDFRDAVANTSPAAAALLAKANNADQWRGWMEQFGRLLVKYRIVRVPEDFEALLDQGERHRKALELILRAPGQAKSIARAALAPGKET